MKLQKNDVILFNGDSITDCGRDRGDFYSLTGYSKIVQNALTDFYPSLGIKSCNRGISGDLSCDLLARLESELKETKATVLSVLIGINDTWRRYDGNDRTTSPEEFGKNYDAILKIAKKYVREIILLEPFLIPTDPEKAKFREDLDPKIQVVRALAVKYKADFVPLDGVFAEKCVFTDPAVLSPDGVHPADDGYSVMAAEWLKRVKA